MTVRRFYLAGIDGEPLTGVTPTLAGYCTVADGVAITPAPLVVEESYGWYNCDIPDNATGFVYEPTAQPQYHFIPCISPRTFGTYGIDGTPRDNRNNTEPHWQFLKNSAGVNITQPAIDICNTVGIFKFTPPDGEYYGVIHIGSFGEMSTQRIAISSLTDTPDSTRPVVINITPTPGTPISASDPVSAEVYDESGLRVVLFLVTYAGLYAHEVIYDGTSFSQMFAGSTVTPTVTGAVYTFIRIGGWPALPTVTPIVIDTSGNENA